MSDQIFEIYCYRFHQNRVCRLINLESIYSIKNQVSIFPLSNFHVQLKNKLKYNHTPMILPWVGSDPSHTNHLIILQPHSDVVRKQKNSNCLF